MGTHLADGRKLKLQALYTVATLARVAGVTPERFLGLLRANGVTLLRHGRTHFVPLSEIELHIPPLWRSLQAVARARVEAPR